MISLRTRTSWARWACRVLGIAAVAAVFAPTSVRAADTVQNFTADFNAVPAAQPTYSGTATTVAGSLNGGADGSVTFGRLVTELNDQRGQIGLPRFPGHTGAYDALTFDFDFRMNDPAAGADGLSFIYLNTANYGVAGSAPDSGEEANATNSFGIGFDTWSNAVPDGTPDGTLPNSFSLHYNNAALLSASTPSLGLPADWLENGNTKHATVTVTPGLGTSTVHLLVTEPSTGITSEPFGILGLDIAMPTYDGRIGFSARTGGENQNTDVDNVAVTFTPTGGGAPIVGTENFEGVALPPQTGTAVGGTPFVPVNLSNTAPGGSIQPETPLPGGGTNQPGYYQLTAEVGGQHNTIAFDKTLPTLVAGDKINLDFDLRMLSNEPTHADGMSIMLIDADTYGSTGPFAPGGVVEDPNIAGVVGVAFDTFDNDENFAAGDPNGCGGGGPCLDRLGNIASAHSNGAQVDVQFVPDGPEDTPLDPNDTISFVNGHWIHVDVNIELVDNGAGGLGGFMDVILTDLANGNTYTPFAGIGLPSVPDDLRLAFGARTGGAFDDHGVDNVFLTMTPVPEPSTFVLFGLAGTGLYVLRRRRK